MRVLHVITRLIAGGAQKNTVATAIVQRRRGIDAQILHGPQQGGSEGNVAVEASDAGVPLHLIASLRRDPSLSHDLLAILATIRFLRRNPFDVVHTHTSKAGFIGRLAARICSVPVVHTPHGHVFHSYYGPTTTALYVLLERCAARWTERMIALTPAERAETLALGIGDPSRFDIVPSGIDLDRFRAARARRLEMRSELGLADPTTIAVGCVGRLEAVKGQDVLIEAIPQLLASRPNTRFLLIGDGSQRTALEQRIRTLDLAASTTLLGHLEDPAPYLAAFDLLVVPSRNEGMGRVIVEAMAAGTPVVASAIGGIPDLVSDRWNGRLFPPGDADALARRLVELIDDPAERSALRERATRSIDSSWGQEAMADALLAVYRRSRDELAVTAQDPMS